VFDHSCAWETKPRLAGDRVLVGGVATGCRDRYGHDGRIGLRAGTSDRM
jgi:hypothetical protein